MFKSILNLLPLALQPAVGFGLSNNTSPFVLIYHQLSPSSHFQHLKIYFYFFCPSFPVTSSSSRPFQFLSEDLLFHKPTETKAFEFMYKRIANITAAILWKSSRCVYYHSKFIIRSIQLINSS